MKLKRSQICGVRFHLKTHFFAVFRNNASFSNGSTRNTFDFAAMFTAVAGKYGIGSRECDTGNTFIVYNGMHWAVTILKIQKLKIHSKKKNVII